MKIKINIWIKAGVLLTAFVFLSACQQRTKSHEAVKKVEQAHGLSHWWNKQIFKARIAVTFGDQLYVDGLFYIEANGPRVKMVLKDGTVVIHDGKNCWMKSDHPKEHPQVRFGILTWPWFVIAPFKMTGHRTGLSAPESFVSEGITYTRLVQRFTPQAGDSPKDWYALILDEKEKRLAGMGYIVTYSKKIEEAEKEPHGIWYEDYVAVAGVVISTRWRFRHYDKEKGFHGDLGSGKVTEIDFVDLEEDTFTPPAGALTVPLPEKS